MITRLFAAALCATVANAAWAQGFDGAATSMGYQTYDDGVGFDLSAFTLRADAAYGLGNGWGVQIGLAHYKETGSSDPFLMLETHGSATLHVYRDFSDTLRAGLMVGIDTYNDGDRMYGAEMIYFDGPWRLEGRIAEYDSSVEPAGLIEARGSYRFDSGLELGVDVGRYTYYGGFGYDQQIALSVGYQVSDSVYVEGFYGDMTLDFGAPPVLDDATNIGLMVRMELGQGRDERLFTYNPFKF